MIVSILLFSLTIAVFTWTHSIGGILLVVGLMLAIAYGWGSSWRQVGYYMLVVLAGVATVVSADLMTYGSVSELQAVYQGSHYTSPGDPNQEFRILSRERSNTYLIQTQDKQQHIVLYSSQSLIPGELIVTTRQPKRREYQPTICMLLCGQSRQLFDSTGFNYDRRLFMQDIDGSLYDNTVVVVGREQLSVLDRVREQFFQHVVQRFGDGDTTIYAGLILGMTIGDRYWIDKPRYTQFIRSGLVHLIAVSGGNIALVVLFLGILLFWVPFYVRQVLLIVVTVCYAMIVGNDSSIIRATVMGLLTLVALLPGRQLSIWRSLTYAWIGMLIYNPYYLLYDMGFILSFSALIGIIWADQYWRSWQSSKKLNLTTSASTWYGRVWGICRVGCTQFISGYIVPTCGAMVGVTPWLLLSMGQMNILSPLVNILIVPLVPLITVLSFVVPYLPRWKVRDMVLLWQIDYVLYLSAVGTQYGIYLTVDVWVKGLLIVLFCGYVLWWINSQTSLSSGEK